jgi:hypothetical protein
MKVIPMTHSFAFEIPSFEEQIKPIQDAIIKSYTKQVEDIFIQSVRTVAKPPIKGKITRGKLKWRGIMLHQTNYGILGSEMQLFQRNTPISPILKLGALNVIAEKDK